MAKKPTKPTSKKKPAKPTSKKKPKLDAVSAALSKGEIPLGEVRLRFGQGRQEVLSLLGAKGTGFAVPVKSAFLWFGESETTLYFQEEKLRAIGFHDPAWKPAGTSWDDYDERIDAKNIEATREVLEAKLGRPHGDLGDSVFWTVFAFGVLSIGMAREGGPSLSLARDDVDDE